MHLPDYEGNGIVNLMSSILGSFGVGSPYTQLSSLGLGSKKNVILLVLDGIGYDYLKEKGKDTFIYDNLEMKLTSVFPSSTASAVPTFMTGLPPQQHGVPGWYTYLKELGVVSTILPFKPRYGNRMFTEDDVDVSSILSKVSLVKRIEEEKHFVTKNKIKDSVFNKFYTKNIEVNEYDKTNEFFEEIERIIKDSENRKYIYGYWNDFDGVAHEKGVDSIQTVMEFLSIDRQLKEFVERVKDTDATLLITADHGFIDSTEDKAVRLEDHPEFSDCLTLPLCGDHRSVFCYVHPDKEDKFRDYWEKELIDYCDLYKSQELVDDGLFGLFEPNSKLLDRIGDYILIMKDNYIMFDTLPNEDDHFLIGNHGGLSSEEIYVPLSIVDL
ncbi:MAG: alkaline phosphatase family protein [Thermoplasmatota archaeon]